MWEHLLPKVDVDGADGKDDEDEAHPLPSLSKRFLVSVANTTSDEKRLRQSVLAVGNMKFLQKQLIMSEWW